jgi:hypothetical protein
MSALSAGFVPAKATKTWERSDLPFGKRGAIAAPWNPQTGSEAGSGRITYLGSSSGNSLPAFHGGLRDDGSVS